VCITILCPRWIIINMCPIESRTSVVFVFFLYTFFSSSSQPRRRRFWIRAYTSKFMCLAPSTRCVCVCVLCYVLFRVRGPELEPPPPPPESYYIACDMRAQPDYPTANSYQRQRCMIYGLPARESRTDGRLHFHFFLSSSYIKICVYNNIIYVHDNNIISPLGCTTKCCTML